MMASSDVEFEALPGFVSDYHFEDANRKIISFSVLPLQWNENKFPIQERQDIFLSGVLGDGLHKIYKLVKAWKYNISEVVPKISVLVKGDYWIQLLKPKKGYADEIMSILIMVHCLHHVRKNPEASAKCIWDHLGKKFSSFGVIPSQDHLSVECLLINDAMMRDRILGKSKVLSTFLREKRQTMKKIDEVAQTSKPAIVVNANVIDDAGNLSDEDGLGVCAICDNGGDLLCCDGPCLRTFHATKKDGADSECESLGLTAAEVNAMQSFVCKNCQYKQHQCFCCWKLGSSDKAIGAEVFKCKNPKCGLFYHPKCIAKVLHEEDETVADIIQGQIAAGESFVCPIHKCGVCKSHENAKVIDLQFAVCRRCPTSYHRKCLKTAFIGLDEENFKLRAWENLLPNRILLYCLKHEIDGNLCTPKRDFQFPGIRERPNSPRSNSVSNSRKAKQKCISILEASRKPSARVVNPSSDTTKGNVKKVHVDHASPKKGNAGSLKKAKSKPLGVKKDMTSLGKHPFSFLRKRSKRAKCRMHPPSAVSVKPVKMAFSGDFRLDEESKRRLLKLITEPASSISPEDIKQMERAGPLENAPFWKNIVDKFITQGTSDGFVEALGVALGKLENGCSIEDAKSSCEPEIVQLALQLKTKIESPVKGETKSNKENDCSDGSLCSGSDSGLSSGGLNEVKLGFVSAPLHPYPYAGSFGWLDE